MRNVTRRGRADRRLRAARAISFALFPLEQRFLLAAFAATEQHALSAPNAVAPPAVAAEVWPDASNTGPNGPLVIIDGPLEISTPGTVLQNVEVRGDVRIAADDVTIRNFRVVGGGVKFMSQDGFEGLLLEDGEITGPEVTSGFIGGNAVLRRLEIHHLASDGLKFHSNVVFEDSYVHHLGMGENSHADGIQARAIGREIDNVVVRRNRFDMPSPRSRGADRPGADLNFRANAAIYLEGVIGDFLVEGNWLNGGNFTVTPGLNGSQVRYVGNFFGRDYNHGIRNSITGTVWNDTNWLGNVWADSGKPALPGTALQGVPGRPGSEPVAQPPAVPVTGRWTPVGSGPVYAGPNPSRQPIAGPVGAVVAHPSDANTLYLASPGGGVWKSTNGGTSWSALTDAQATRVIGALAIAPSNGNVLYAATGDPLGIHPVGASAGVLKSTNGGSSWSLVGQGAFDGGVISRLAVHPTDANTLFASVVAPGSGGATGVWRSTDGGGTWSHVTTALTPTLAFTDIAVLSSGATPTLLTAIGVAEGAAENGIYRSTDGGTTWSPASGTPTGEAVGTVRFGADRTSGTVYALLAGTGQPGSTPAGTLYRALKSTDGGATWSEVTLPELSATDPVWNAATVAVAPGGGAVVVAANGTLVRSTDGGASWTDIRAGTGGTGPHALALSLAFAADGDLVAGTGGGVWRRDGGGASGAWDNLNAGLPIAQAVGVATPAGNPLAPVGSFRGTGVASVGTGAWSALERGEGGRIVASPTSPNTLFHAGPKDSFGAANFIRRSDDGGATWRSIVGGIDPAEPTAFHAPLVAHGTDGDLLFFGTDRVYRTTDGGDTWDAISTPGASGWTATEAVDAIAVSESSPNTIYASAGGHVFVTTNGGASWAQRDPAGASNVGFADILVDPSNPLVACVVAAGTGAETGPRVWGTTDGGANWSNITGNLPAGSVWSAAADFNNAGTGDNVLFVGTDEGVYVTTNLGGTWTRLGGASMPNVLVRDLDYDTQRHVLTAATAGRGVWQTVVQQGGPVVVGHRPSHGAVQAPTFIDVHFSADMNAGSFSVASDVTQFTGPGGVDVKGLITGFTWTNARTLRLNLASLPGPGAYTLKLGPQVLAASDGAAMDQDGDGTTGEAATDGYTATLDVDPPGPDAAGYEALPATFDPTIDLVPGASGVATVVDGADDEFDDISLGTNTFTFYGTTYGGTAGVWVSTNGLITFGAPHAGPVNSDLSSDPLGPAIAPLWDDWRADRDSADRVLRRFDDTTGDGVPDRLVIEWNQVTPFAETSAVTFQAILQLNTGTAPGSIVFNYPDLATAGPANGAGGATVGVKGVGADTGERVLVARDDAGNALVGTGKAVRIAAPDAENPFAAVTDVASRSSPVDQLVITFSEPVTGFNLADLSLTRNGGANLLTGSQTLTTTDNAMTWVLGNVAGLTAPLGSYALTLNAAGSGIVDAALNPLLDGASDTWQNTLAATIGSLTASPNPVVGGQDLTLTANNVNDADGAVAELHFYQETNGVAGLQIGDSGDLLAAIDFDVNDADWSGTASTFGLPAGTYTYYALAIDDAGAPSALGTSAASTSVTVTNVAPTLAGAVASPDPTPREDLVTLVATGVSDPDNAVTVSFWLESNALPGLQTEETGGVEPDEFLGAAPTGGPHEFTFLADGFELGTHTFHARGTDTQGALSNVVTGTFTLTDHAPVVDSVTASPDPVAPGTNVTLTANGVADPDGSVLQVFFYRETNGTPGLQAGAGGDLQVGVDASSGGGWKASASTDGLGLGTYTYYAVAQDALGQLSTAASGTSVVANNPPIIGALAASPQPVVQGAPVTLTATNVTDPDNPIASVNFYRESNNVAGLQTGAGGDALVGTDLLGSGAGDTTFDVQAATAGLPVGTYTYYAQATDAGGLLSNVVSTTSTIGNQPPAIASLSATPNPVVLGSNVVLLANGVSDPDNSVDLVHFYRETNGTAGLQTGAGGDALVGTDNSVNGGGWTFTFDTDGLTTGTQTFYAFAVDNQGLAGNVVSASTQVVNQSPTIGSLSVSPEPVPRGGTVTVTAVNVADPDTDLARVTFWRETNGTAGLQTGAGGDLEVGFDESAAGGYKVDLATAALPGGTYTYYARAADEFGAVSNDVSGTSTVQESSSPAPSGLFLVAATDSGVLDDDDVTNFDNSSPARALQINVTGTTAGATVKVYADGALMGSAVSAAGGTMTVTTAGTLDLADGVRQFTATQTLPGQGESAPTAAFPITIDTAGPTGDIADVTPDPRTTAVDAVTITFNGPVHGFTLADLTLTLNGAGGNRLTGAQTLTSSDGGVTWTLRNLASATSASGTFALTLNAAGVTDAAGNALVANVIDTWVTSGFTAAYQQDAGADGIVSIEVETNDGNVARGNKSWTAVSSAAYSGGQALQALPNTGTIVNGSGTPTTAAQVDFKVNFVKTGIHHVWIRGAAATSDDDSVHIGLDGAFLGTSDRITDFNATPGWSKTTMDSGGVAATINVTSVGEHTINLWMREDGFVADKIVLTTNANYVPTGLGPPTSPRGDSPPANAPPTVTSLSVSPGSVTQGQTFTLTANGVADTDGNLSAVAFYRDANGNGTLEVGTDVLLGTDTSSTGGWTLAASTAGLAPGTYTFLARAADAAGAFSAAVSATGTVTAPANNAPTVGSLTVSPGSVVQGQSFTLTANNVADADGVGTIASVSFYRDANGNGTLEVGTDVLLGTDASATGGWTLVTSTAGLAPGTYTFLARAADVPGAFSNVVTAAGTVTAPANNAPTIGSLSANPTTVSAGGNVVLTASGVADTDGNLSAVEFYRDANGNGTFEAGTDALAGTDTNGADGWSLTVSTTGLPAGTQAYFARARDSANAYSAAVSTSVQITAPSGPAAYQQDAGADGIVSIEVEVNDGTVTRGNKSWTAVSNAAYSGGQALQALPNTGTIVNGSGTPTTAAQVDFKVNFVKIGIHHVWIRGAAATSDDDSVHVGLDGVFFGTSDRITDFDAAPDWSKTTMDSGGVAATINVTSTGLHTINLWMREDGFVADKIVLITNANYVPTGLGPPTSPRNGGEPPANTPPTVGSLSVNPASVEQGQNVTLTANNVADVDGAGTIASVAFYRDANGNGTLEVGTDVLLGTDTSSAGGWSFVAPTTGVAPGTYAYFARAADVPGAFSNVASASGTVTPPNVAPTVGSLTVSPGSVQQGQSFTLTANSVADANGNLSAVEFFRDANGNGTLEVGTDVLLGTDASATGGWTLAVSTGSLAPNTYTFFTRAKDVPGLTSNVVSATGTVTAAPSNAAPAVGSLTVSPSPVEQGDDFGLTANSVADADGNLASVAFYRDVNGNGTLDVGTDVLVGTDTSATGGWSVTVATTGLSPGTYTFLARATDTLGLTSNVVSATGTVTAPPNTPPTIGSLSAAPSSVVQGASVTLTANSVADADGNGTLAAVEFYRDANDNGAFDAGTDTLLGTDTNGGDGWSLVTSTAGLAPDGYAYFARAKDAPGAFSNVATTTVTVTAPSGPAAYQQDAGADGIVSIEVEVNDGTVTRNGKSWSLVSNGVYSGGQAMQVLPNTGTTVNGSATPTTAPQVDFKVNFVKTGVHHVWIRGVAPSGGDDSVHIGFDGVYLASSDRIADFDGAPEWSEETMDKGVTATINVTTAGLHTINLWMREDGFIADKILLTTNPNYVPSGLGPPTSPRTGGEPPPPNANPTVGSLSVAPNSVTQGQSFTLTANNVADADGDGTIAAVAFYRDANNNGTLEVGTDVLLGTDTSSAGGWTFVTSTAGLSAGTYTYLARATDAPGAFSNVVTATGTVTAAPNNAPTVTSLSAAPTSVQQGQNIVLSANGVADTDGNLSAVEFYRDANGNGTLEVGTDVLLGTDTSSAGGWTFTVATAGLSPATYTFLARAKDAANAFSGVVTTSATVTEATGPAAYQQDAGADGIVSIEAEAFDATVTRNGRTWTLVSNAVYSGGQAMQVLPNTGTTVNGSATPTTAPQVDFKVNFVKTGVHHVWIRGVAPSGGDDSVHIGFDGVYLASSDRIADFDGAPEWSEETMDKGVTATINVTTAGLHTINLWMREDGFIADKIVLTTNANYVPTGFGPPTSPRGGGGARLLSAAVETVAQEAASDPATGTARVAPSHLRPSATLFADRPLTADRLIDAFDADDDTDLIASYTAPAARKASALHA